MLKSMTGYGRANAALTGKKVTIEIKSLNGKQLDVNLRMPAFLREKEPEIRAMLASVVERGKTDIIFSTGNSADEQAPGLNTALLTAYYNSLKSLADQLGASDQNLFSVALQLPEVMNQPTIEMSEEEWASLKQAIIEALNQLDEFRLHEGGLLEKDFEQRISTILVLLDKIAPFEQQRMLTLREKMLAGFAEYFKGSNLDQNRFEQELIYYIEKLDITEEKVRLRKHCDYFIATMAEPASSGRKLSFITQEIGREINTLGSKANDASIQTFVVEMKDELEKIKEQLANIL